MKSQSLNDNHQKCSFIIGAQKGASDGDMHRGYPRTAVIYINKEKDPRTNISMNQKTSTALS